MTVLNRGKAPVCFKYNDGEMEEVFVQYGGGCYPIFTGIFW